MTDPAAPVSSEAIVVHLGAGRFAIALDSIAEVGRVPRVTPVPAVPQWLAGVANWRGRILPVLELRPMLGAAATELGHPARLVVLAADGLTVGLLVDAVAGTTALDEVAAFPSAAAPIGAGLISGQSPRADGPLAVLDVPAVMRLRDELPKGRRTA